MLKLHKRSQVAASGHGDLLLERADINCGICGVVTDLDVALDEVQERVVRQQVSLRAWRLRLKFGVNLL